MKIPRIEKVEGQTENAMIIFKVNEELNVIKDKLAPLVNEVCILHGRKGQGDFIVTLDSNQGYILNLFSVESHEEFTDAKRVDLIRSDDYRDYLIIGRADFVT